MYQPINQYAHTMTNDRILNARPEDLIIMLYEGMITKTLQAKERFMAGQTIRAQESTINAMRIADALMENVNLEQGGETAKNLESLYLFIVTEFSKANRSKEPIPHLENCIRVLEPLLQSWKDLKARVAA